MDTIVYGLVSWNPRPAVVKATLAVELPRPRPLALKRQPALLARVDEIWRLIEEEVRSGMVPRGRA
jgi:NitT/TauT family transport system ATP-binding protein